MKEKKRVYKTRGATRILNLGEVREIEINEREGEREIKAIDR